MKPKFNQGQSRAGQIHRDLLLTRNTFELSRPQAKSTLAAPKTSGIQNLVAKADKSANLNSSSVKNEVKFAQDSGDYQLAFNAGVAQTKQSMESAFRKQFEIELEKIKTLQFKEARDAGYLEGKDQGYAEGKTLATKEFEKNRADCEQQALQLNLLIDSFRLGISQKYLQMQDDLSEICFIGLAQLLVENIVKPEVITAKIRDLLQQQISNDQVDVHLHPEDCRLLLNLNSEDQNLDQLAQHFKKSNFNLIADPEVKLGGVMMRSGKNSLDARLDYQLEQVKQSILQSREAVRGQYD